MEFKDSGGGDYQQAPVDTHIARCIAVIDLGTQYNEKYQNYRRQVFIQWELPNAVYTYKDENDVEQENIFVIGKFYTASLNEKANLRKDLESWRGVAFSEEELQGFSSDKLIGVPAMLTVVHNDKGKAKVAAVVKPPKGMEIPAAVHDTTNFSIDPWNQEAFEKLPEGFRKMIEKSEEYKTRVPEQPTQTTETATTEFVDDDIPF